MLSIGNVTEAHGSFYYEKEDYYTRENSPAKSEFLGRGAEALGIKEFDNTIYQNLILGLTPDGTEQLTYYSRKPLDADVFGDKIIKTFEKLADLGLNIEDSAKLNNEIFNVYKEKTLTPLELRALKKELHSITKSANLDHDNRKAIRNELSKLLNGMRNKTREAAYDLTFSAPKSVSLQLLINKDQRILAAHEQAVKYSLAELEKRVVRAMEGSRNQRKRVNTGNMIIATFPHGTSREGDPQLHTHALVFNMTQRSDSKWRAISNQEFYRQAKLGGMIYQNRLAQLCQNLGYEIEVTANGTFELKGFNDQHLKTFSTRSIQVKENSARILYENSIAADLESKAIEYDRFEKFEIGYFRIKIDEKTAKRLKLNIIDNKSGYIISDGKIGKLSFDSRKHEFLKLVTTSLRRTGVLKGRKIKTDLDFETLASGWKKKALELNLSNPSSSKSRANLVIGKPIDTNFHEQHLSERTAAWSQLEAEMAALTINMGRTDFHSLLSELHKQGFTYKTDLQPVEEDSTYKTFTNLDILSLEDEILRNVRNNRGKFSAISNEDTLQDVLAEKNLTPGQECMIKGVLTSTDFAVTCLGVAGSGKSYAAKTIKQQVLNSGMSICGLAPDASSAQALEAKSGIKSETIHKYLSKQKRSMPNSIYTKGRREFATKLARIGIHRSDLRSLSRQLVDSFEGNRLTAANAKTIRKLTNEVSDNFSNQKQKTIQILTNEFLSNFGDKESILIVDECSKLSSQLANRLIKRALHDGSRIVFLGDLRQTGAIEAGNPIGSLIKDKAILQFNLPEPVRQKEGSMMRKIVNAASLSSRLGLKASVDLLAKKDLPLDTGQHKSQVITRRTKDKRIGLAIREYMKFIHRGENDIMLLADLNTDRYALTDQLRTQLKEIGKIDEFEKTITTLKERDLTQEQKEHSRYYNTGDFIVFHKSIGTVENNQIYKVGDINHDKNKIALIDSQGTTWLSVKDAKTATLFTENTIAVAKGDTLRWTRNHENRVNKNLVSVVEVNRNSIVVEDKISGRRDSISTKMHCHLDYGLVMTVYSSQGHDRKHGVFLAESNVSMNTWYTALTRMKESITVITDNKDKLIDRINRSTTKINALDLMENRSGWIELREENRKADLAPTVEPNRDGPELGH